MKRYRAVIFDLDGTLLDTLDDLAESVNQALRRLGLPEHDVDSYRWRVGDGIVKLAQRALPPDRQDLVEELLSLQKPYYAEHYADQTRPYTGVAEMLTTLRERGYRLAVLSNKPDPFTQQVVARLLKPEQFDAIWGHREGYQLKPDPTAALALAEELETPPEAVAYLGDSGVDMQTATQAGFLALGAAWGFRDRSELIRHGAVGVLDAPLQLPVLLDG